MCLEIAFNRALSKQLFCKLTPSKLKFNLPLFFGGCVLCNNTRIHTHILFMWVSVCMPNMVVMSEILKIQLSECIIFFWCLWFDKGLSSLFRSQINDKMIRYTPAFESLNRQTPRKWFDCFACLFPPHLNSNLFNCLVFVNDVVICMVSLRFSVNCLI